MEEARALKKIEETRKKA